MNKSVKQQSLAPDPLIKRVRDEIAVIENKHKGACSRPKTRRVVLISSAKNASGQIISAREDWIIDRCGIDIIYQVDFYGPLREQTNLHVQERRRSAW